ncbi:hypothetical protein V1515DRAFT_520181, partial [Lipomyces mesembrius]
LSIDSNRNHNVVLADLDDEHFLIAERMVELVKREVDFQLAENTFRPAEPDNV